MYLLNEKTVREMETISQHIHNTYDLGLYLDNLYVTEPITSIIDEEYLINSLKLANECNTKVERIYKEYKGIRYVRQQLASFSYELNIIKHNIILIQRKKSIEISFDLAFGVSDISWQDFELLYTEYYSEVLNINDVPYKKLTEMYYVILGRPHMTMEEFLNHCTACGGDWVSMLLSGIKECYPDDYIGLKAKCESINSNSGAEEFCLLGDFLSEYITDWEELK